MLMKLGRGTLHAPAACKQHLGLQLQLYHFACIAMWFVRPKFLIVHGVTAQLDMTGQLPIPKLCHCSKHL